MLEKITERNSWTTFYTSRDSRSKVFSVFTWIVKLMCVEREKGKTIESIKHVSQISVFTVVRSSTSIKTSSQTTLGICFCFYCPTTTTIVNSHINSILFWFQLHVQWWKSASELYMSWRALFIHLKCPITTKRYKSVTSGLRVSADRVRERKRRTRLRVNICKWGLNNFRLFLCPSSGLVLKCFEWATRVAFFSAKARKEEQSQSHKKRIAHNRWGKGRWKRDECENSKANQINLIIKKSS